MLRSGLGGKIKAIDVLDRDLIELRLMTGDNSFELYPTGKFGKVFWNGSFGRGTFERAGSRLEVCVTLIPEWANVSGSNYGQQRYIVSVPNFHWSGEFENLNRVAYQMRDKTNYSQVDCDSVQIAAMSLAKEYMQTYREQFPEREH